MKGKRKGKGEKKIFSKHSKHSPEISFNATESNPAHNKGKPTHELNLSKAKHTPTRSIIPAVATSQPKSPPPIYPPPPSKCTLHSLAQPKQITPRWLSAHFSNYVRITTSNPIISQMPSRGFVCWPSARGAGVQPVEAQHRTVQTVMPWWTWLVVVFVTLTDSHSRNKTLHAFVCASSIWRLALILLYVLLQAFLWGSTWKTFWKESNVKLLLSFLPRFLSSISQKLAIFTLFRVV